MAGLFGFGWPITSFFNNKANSNSMQEESTITSNGCGGGVGAFRSLYPPFFKNCTFRRNDAAVNGGAFFIIEDENTTPWDLRDCVVQSNNAFKAGGGVFFVGNRPLFTFSLLSSNTANYSGNLASPPEALFFEIDSWQNQTIGKSFSPEVEFTLRDVVGSVVTFPYSLRPIVKVSIEDNTVELQGTREEQVSKNGIIRFSNLGLLGPSGGPYGILFRISVPLVGGNVRDLNTTVFVNLDKCRPGEQFLDSKCQLCPEGKYSTTFDSETCTRCLPGRYQNATGGARCVDCPPGSFACDSGFSKCLFCSENFYHVGNSSSSRCEPCPKLGAICEKGQVYSKTGFFVTRDMEGIARAIECPDKFCEERSKCAANRKLYRENAMCGACNEGYYDWNNVCVK